MQVRKVDSRTWKLLEEIQSRADKKLGETEEQSLRELGLLTNGQATSGTKSSQNKAEDYPVVNMAMLLTQSCNLNCVYCYGEGGSYGSGGNMDEQTAFQAVDWLLQQSGKKKKIHVGFFGGEPFLNFLLMQKIVDYARKRCAEEDKKVAFHATTNGTLLDSEKIEFIRDNEISVMVSLDGPKEIHDAQRPFKNGQGSYDIIVDNCKNLLKAKPDTPAHAVLMGDKDLEMIKNALLEIGFADASVTSASSSLFDEQAQKEKEQRDTAILLQEMEQEAAKWTECITARNSDCLHELKSKGQLYMGITSLLHNSKRRHPCGAGLGLVGVSADGGVYLCHRFVGQEEYKLGTVFEDKLNRQPYQETVDMHPVCAQCFARYYCAGGCKHDNAGTCDSVFSPAGDMCRLRCRELELAASVVARLDEKDIQFLNAQDIVPPKPCPLDIG
jgi:uncharacterized protein